MMTHEEMMRILMADSKTKREAERRIRANTAVIYDDFEERFDSYMNEWFGDWNEEDRDEEVEKHREMIETGEALLDWGIVNLDGKRYYILYEN